jgi:RNA polymerase primary sigma factor
MAQTSSKLAKSNVRSSSSKEDYFDDDDVVQKYLREMGNLPRLSHEEEIFYTSEYYRERGDFDNLLCHFPVILQKRISECKSSEIFEVAANNRKVKGKAKTGDETVDAKKERILHLIDALEKTAEHLYAIRDDQTEKTANKRSLMYQTLERLIQRFHFHGKLYQDCMADLTRYADAVNSKSKEISPKEVDDIVSMPSADLLALMPALKHCSRLMESARNAVIEANLRLVISVAKRYLNCGIPLLDLIQEGNIGLMQAIDRFEPERGHRFSTYAVWWIRQAVTHALSMNSRTIRIPVNMANALYRIRKAEKVLLQELGREPKPEEIAECVDITVERVRALRKMERQTISLQAELGFDDDFHVYDLIMDRSVKSPADEASSNLLAETIADVLDTLSDRERNIIIHRFGLLQSPTLTLEQLSSRFDVTHERIRQIEKIALKKLRHPSRRRFFDNYL